LPEIGRELKRRNENRTMKHFLVWVILLSMPLRSSLASPSPRQAGASEITKHPQTKAALDWFEPHQTLINEVQINLRRFLRRHIRKNSAPPPLKPYLPLRG
jgi:hypothetical protein